MGVDRSPFLTGALAWIYDGGTPDVCPTCGWSWTIGPDDAVRAIAEAPDRYEVLLDGRDGMAAAADGGWNATGYLWHLTDLARSWGERWAQLEAVPGSLLVGWDPDVLADARGYRRLPTSAAIWALRGAVTSFVEIARRVPHAVAFEHGDWGAGNLADALRWLGHEFVHHQLDVDERAVPSEAG